MKIDFFASGHRVALRIDDCPEVDEGDVMTCTIPDAAATKILRRLLDAMRMADASRKALTGANEWRAHSFVGNTCFVDHNDLRSKFRKHIAAASRFKRSCVQCRAPFAVGDVYWSEAPCGEQKDKRRYWGGHMLCDRCVRPESLAAGILGKVATDDGRAR